MTAYSLAMAALPIQMSGRSGGDEYAAAGTEDSSVRDDAAPFNARTMNINQLDCMPSLAAS